MMKVMVNWRSMNPAAADAPTGSHQVLATKKYVLIKVISHIKTINARPIPSPPGQERISPRRLSRFVARSTVGGECNTAAQPKSNQGINSVIAQCVRFPLASPRCGVRCKSPDAVIPSEAAFQAERGISVSTGPERKPNRTVVPKHHARHDKIPT